MSPDRYISICYPDYNALTESLRSLPLSARSLLIKVCQSQTDIHPSDTSTLPRLLQAHPEVVIRHRNRLITLPLIEVFPTLGITVNDPLQSAIILDVIRCTTLDISEVVLAKEKGWATEIRLAETPGRPTTNFSAFFFDTTTPLHPDLPFNMPHLLRIRYRFRKFRQSLIDELPIFYRRGTHKNMSRSTRRDFEEIFDTSLDGFDIFGQDDWQRVYHETGVQLGGVVEMRQTWTPAVAKPRTYFAMGGITYNHSGHLQDFFSELVNLFPATNHITRLRPSRLRLSLDDSSGHYRIYDLSFFTSNLKEQRSFMESLKSFFRGVTVCIVDEREGPIYRDLGDLLDEYYNHCVSNPELSYERCCFADVAEIHQTYHGRASMLGIFGNLMTATLCHYLIMSPTVSMDDEINIAGDDGLVLETLMNKYLIGAAISVVGECAEEKTFRSDELGAICLKRPIVENPPTIELLHNVVPPNLAVSVSYLLGKPVEPRFQMYNLDDLPVKDRVSVVGKDLLRFLESSYTWGMHLEEVLPVYRGFSKLVAKICHFNPVPGHLGRTGYVWPINPLLYDWYSTSPLDLYALVCCQGLEFQKREVVSITAKALRYAGDECQGNSNPRLVLLERLGYLEKKPIKITLGGIQSVTLWLQLNRSNRVEPSLYTYSCLKDIPDCFVFDVSDL